jgi:SAM-dependent MidA family methyltransferase
MGPTKADLEINRKLEKTTRPIELVREFIDDSLYDTSHGYFIKNVNIFRTPEEGLKFNEFKDRKEYFVKVKELYDDQSSKEKSFLQLFHTPSEIFKPHYGHAVARYMVEKYKEMKYDGDFVVYEVGPGVRNKRKEIT